jgi:hypothetical protein
VQPQLKPVEKMDERLLDNKHDHSRINVGSTSAGIVPAFVQRAVLYCVRAKSYCNMHMTASFKTVTETSRRINKAANAM